MLVIVILGTCWRLLFSLFSLLAPAYRMSAPSEYELGKGRDSRVLLAGLALAVGSSGLGDVDPIGEKERGRRISQDCSIKLLMKRMKNSTRRNKYRRSQNSNSQAVHTSLPSINPFVGTDKLLPTPNLVRFLQLFKTPFQYIIRPQFTRHPSHHCVSSGYSTSVLRVGKTDKPRPIQHTIHPSSDRPGSRSLILFISLSSFKLGSGTDDGRWANRCSERRKKTARPRTGKHRIPPRKSFSDVRPSMTRSFVRYSLSRPFSTMRLFRLLVLRFPVSVAPSD